MKKKVWISVALAVAVVIVGVVVGFFLLRDSNPGDSEDLSGTGKPEAVGNAVVGEGTVEADLDRYDTPPSLGDESDQDNYVMNMWSTTWRFKDGSSPSYDVEVQNDSYNTQTVYLELKMSETEEVLFVSDYLKPGEAIHDIALGKDLDQGEYKCVLTYHLMDEENQNETGTVSLAITVIVEN